jgi:AcrR family transcriptional regulator
MLAAELRLQGASVIVLEAMAVPSPHARAFGLYAQHRDDGAARPAAAPGSRGRAGTAVRRGDLFAAGRPVLLDLTDDPAVRKEASGWTGRVDVVTARPVAPHDRDFTGPLLARPDGYVAWAGAAGLRGAWKTGLASQFSDPSGTAAAGKITQRDSAPGCPAPEADLTEDNQPRRDTPARQEWPSAGQERPLRADARRNRDSVLEAAFAAFAAEGLSVPVHEIARRAGVGTGTVSRHFPTKESLFAAVFMNRAESLVRLARRLAEADRAGEALFEFFAALVAEGAANRGLADALTGTGFDIKAAVSGPDRDVTGAMASLLARAQQAGAVRPDVDVDDVLALATGCLARHRGTDDPAARERLVAVVCTGLRRQAPSS